MNEITVLDALLLAWAVTATVQALNFRRIAAHHIRMLTRILENDALRERIVADYKRVFGSK